MYCPSTELQTSSSSEPGYSSRLTLPWTVPRPAEKRGGLCKGLTTLSGKKKTDCYENIDQRNSNELGRGRASWGQYDAMQ